MARSHYRGTIFGNLTTGAKPLPGAAVRLFDPVTGVVWPYPVYPDPTNGAPYAMPIRTNAVGELELWADEPAQVRAEITHPSFYSVGEVIEIATDPDETATDGDLEESVADHEAKEDPHEQYLTQPEGDELYKPIGYEPDLTDYYTKGEADDEFLDQDESDLRYEQLSRKGMPSGYVPLDLGGLVPNQYLPPLAITETFVCLSEAEMLALPAQQGDVAVRLDTTENYILRVDPATVLANWTKLAASTTAGNTSVLRREEFTPAPLATTVTLAAPPTTIHAVSRNGVGQSQPAGHYSLSGLVLTFTDPFVLGERVAVVYEIGSTVPAPVNGYTKLESDARYEPLDTMYTKAESDAKYLTQVLGDARYSLISHTHPYLALSGGNLTGALTILTKPVDVSPDGGNALVWRSNGFYSSGSGGNVTVINREEFFPAAAATTVTLAQAPTELLSVSRNGVDQFAGSGNYTLAGAVVTFSDAFVAGEKVSVLSEVGTSVPVDAYTTAQSEARYVNVTGDTMTGPLVAPIRDKAGAVFNVMAYGATGDGTTDDTAFINAAIAAVPASGGVVYFPPGTYRHTAAIDLSAKNGLTMRGAGKTASVLQSAHTGHGLVSHRPINVANVAHLVIEDLGVVNTNAANTGAAIDEVAGIYVHIHRVRTQGFRYGLVLDQSECVDVEVCDFELFLSTGVWLCNGPDHTAGAQVTFTNRISITKCQFNRATAANTYGIADDGGYAHVFDANNYNGMGVHVRLASCQGTTVSGSEFEGSATYPVFVTSTTLVNGTGVGLPTGLEIRGNLFVPVGTQPAVYFQGGSAITVSGNYFSTSSTALVGVGSVGAISLLSNICPGTLADAQAAWTHLEASSKGANEPVRVKSLTASGPVQATGATGAYLFNSRDGASIWQWYASQAGGAQLYQQSAGYNGNRVAVGPTGTLVLTPDAGATGMTVKSDGGIYLQDNAVSHTWNLHTLINATYFRISHDGTLRAQMDSSGTLGLYPNAGANALLTQGTIVPSADNAYNVGLPAYRWSTVYAAVGTIQTSVASMKEAFAPLDPVACADAVAGTDWVNFRYLPPEGINAETRAATAPARQQKGYVLQSPAHKTADLFGLSDRESTSVASDLAVVACALQHALQEIATLKAQLGASGV